MDFDLDDYSSFSGVVNSLQNDRAAAKTALIHLAEEHERTQDSIEAIERNLERARQRLEVVQEAVDNVFKHMVFSKPLAVQMEHQIIVFSDTAITIEENVL